MVKLRVVTQELVEVDERLYPIEDQNDYDCSDESEAKKLYRGIARVAFHSSNLRILSAKILADNGFNVIQPII